MLVQDAIKVVKDYDSHIEEEQSSARVTLSLAVIDNFTLIRADDALARMADAKSVKECINIFKESLEYKS